MKKIAFLVLIHKDISCLISFASQNLDMNFYIHLDKKINFEKFILESPRLSSNIYFLESRVSINWAGFSMIQASLNLMNFALSHSENEYFHLISGDDVILKKRDNLIWEDNLIYIEKYKTLDNRYRMRHNFFYADTYLQRKFLFKIFTQIIKKIDLFFITQKKFYCGSQWFSIKKNELSILISQVDDEDINFFRKKLCPDEHFFQYIIEKNNLDCKVSSCGNKRLIIFDKSYQNGSSPIFLQLDQLLEAYNKDYWFARKVKPDVMKKFYNIIAKK